MRRTLIALVAGLLFALAAAAPALAQRDPFEPQVGEQPAGGGAQQPQESPRPAPTVPAETGTGRLAETGSDIDPWLVAAYTFVAVGAGIVVLTKTRRAELDVRRAIRR